jgi:hypothetical protein
MQPKLIINFAHDSDPTFLVESKHIIVSLTGNANFPEPWPASVPSLAALNAMYNDYEAAYNDAKGGDKAKIAIRGQKRAILEVALKTLAAYLEIEAKGDVAKLQTTGYRMRHDATKHAPVTALAALTNVSVVHGKGSGQFELRGHCTEVVDNFEVQSNATEPPADASWVAADVHSNCGKIELSGFTPAKTYSFRIRPIKGSLKGPWVTVGPIISL